MVSLGNYYKWKGFYQSSRAFRLIIYSLALFFFMVFVMRNTPWWPSISLMIKHTPLCFAMNNGLINHRFAYYSPLAGATVDVLRCTPKNNPMLSGHQLDHDIVVVSDFGRIVQRFDSAGHVIWKHPMNNPSGIDVQGNRVFVIDGQTLHILDAKTGSDITVLDLQRDALALKVDGKDIYVAHNGDGSDILVRYEIQKQQLRQMHIYPVRLQYPRGIDLGGDILYVEDTFGHRVLGLDVTAGLIRYEASSYYPHSVQVVDGAVLVAEEHLNTVTNFSIDLKRHLSKLACQTVRELEDLNVIRSHANEVGINGQSLCRVSELTANNNLFSPNDYRWHDGFSYIADTDNQRIVIFKGKELWSVLNGFNSPVNIRLLDALPSVKILGNS